MHRWGAENEGRQKWLYIAFGTNRYWALDQLGATTFPAILSMNKGKTPPWEATLISPEEFRNYAPPGRIYVDDHAFGYTLDVLPEEEFGSK